MRGYAGIAVLWPLCLFGYHALHSRRKLLKAGLALGAASLGLYTWRIEPHWLEIVQRPLPIARLPDSLAGKRLVQISDLHIGPKVDDDYLINTFERVRRMAPEIVVYTGDFISRKDEVDDQAKRVFSHCALGSLGTFGVLGNHDYGLDFHNQNVANEVAALATDSGITLLRNQVTEVAGLQVCGMEDLWGGNFDMATLRLLRPDKPSLVLSHNPDSADRPGWDDFGGWILCGHTHGGQCKPPFLPPPLLPVNNRRYTAGVFDLDGGRKLYINRGVGYLYRVRFNVRPEVTVFELVAA